MRCRGAATAPALAMVEGGGGGNGLNSGCARAGVPGRPPHTRPPVHRRRHRPQLQRRPQRRCCPGPPTPAPAHPPPPRPPPPRPRGEEVAPPHPPPPMREELAAATARAPVPSGSAPPPPIARPPAERGDFVGATASAAVVSTPATPPQPVGRRRHRPAIGDGLSGCSIHPPQPPTSRRPPAPPARRPRWREGELGGGTA